MKHLSGEEQQKIESGCRHKKEQHFISWKFILRNRTVWALMLMYFTFQWANYFFVAWMPVYLQEGRHISEDVSKNIIFILFIAGIAGLIAGGFVSDWLVRKKGLRFGRRLTGMTGIGMCGLMILLAALVQQNNIAAACLVGANFSYSFGVMSSYGVCADIGRNNTGTVTGAMNFAGQTGAFFLAIIFGKIAEVTHSFQYPLLIVAAVLAVGFLLWFVIDPLRQVAVPGKK